MVSSARDDYADDVESRFTAKLKRLRSELQPSLALFFFQSHRQVLFVFVHAASEDGVVACTREILVFSNSFHS